MIADYDELKAAIADFLNREDLSAVIPTFIRLAESRIDRDLRHWRQEKRVSLSLTGQFNDVLPADYLQAIRLQLNDTRTAELSQISNAMMLQLREERGDTPGRPENYLLTAGQIEVYPTPDATYTASLLYYGRITALSDSATVNWLLLEAPDAYLYGALIHAAPYLKDDSRLAVWESLYKMTMDSLTVTSEDARWGGTGLRIRTRK